MQYHLADSIPMYSAVTYRPISDTARFFLLEKWGFLQAYSFFLLPNTLKVVTIYFIKIQYII